MIIIKQETPTSIEAINLLQKSCEYLLTLQDDFDHEYKLEVLVSDHAKFFIVRIDRVAVGCGAYIHISQDVVELKHIYLDDSTRGLGLGKELLIHIESIARRNSVKTIVLETVAGMAAAYAMYQKFGYSECDPYIQNPLHDSIFMSKSI